uniref:Site-specific recombinase XerD n=1 Tax=Candidatus Kentrum sp. FM TaxID=2126340 RepID=A0A450S7E6_9GAMM|nr:MAG: Site-specific recombinase XerD [Candidatus Kentron sp. FM]VFJ47822.1 MAG: Site-specific recombinase XerD [Candidatus Kentron sp. FM]VFK07874.1 MAG: Site-specific recombinase XerD [Candidatus Kentron sp. FM]
MASDSGIRKLADGRYMVDIRPEGRAGPRYRHIWPTRREARQDKNRILAKADAGKDWKPAKPDTRRLQDLIEEWHRLHGETLKGAANRKRQLDLICRGLGNPMASAFCAADFLRYRKTLLDRGVSENTCNHYLVYLKGVFNFLSRLGSWPDANPIGQIAPLKFDESQVAYLDTGAIRSLLSALRDAGDRDTLVITRICLATGARWGEAQTLEAERVKDGFIHFVGTKSGRARAVPIGAGLERDIKEGKGETGRLFPGDHVKKFSRALQRAGITLPKGQRSHVLRHSFAVHFMRRRGNILDLQRILGHASLQMTLRYTGYHPDYLADAITKNPLAELEPSEQGD